MVFNSLSYVLFFAVVLVLHNLPLSWSLKKANLLIASYIFYAFWYPPFIVLLWASTLVNWLIAGQMHRQATEPGRKRWLYLALVFNLGTLGFFKYWKFAFENWQALLGVFGVQYQIPEWNILLPIGISFFTFHSMSYTLDVYWRRVEPIPKLFDFALFVAFFTQLVAGPILRTAELVPQFARARVATVEQLWWGLALITLGLFEKVVLADGALAPTADAVFGNGAPVAMLDAWLGALAFTGQIFCDFAGYSTIAIGSAMCLGFSIPNNFRAPFAAVGFAEYWNRWHISLSSWLRDYVYFPLGGSRKGPIRTYVNIMATMLLSGLWHGASWNFVVWGGLFGVFLCLERMLKRATAGWNLPTGESFRFALALLTFTLICMTRVFFRADSFPDALAVLGSMFGLNPAAASVLPTVWVLEVVICMLALLSAHWYMRNKELEQVVSRASPALTAGTWACLAFAVIITQGRGDAFIYFQF
jgi:alginate O-acetyltransferase complex protein AlgI